MKYRLTSIALILLIPILVFSLMSDFARLFALPDTKEVLGGQVLAPITLTEPPSLSISAQNAVLMTKEGVVIYGKNEHLPAEMASTTKVMTAYLAVKHLEKHGINETVTVSEAAVGAEGSSIYLEKGEEVYLLDLLYAVMLASANDAALCLAEAIGGTVEDFVSMMNEEAKALGLDGTQFKNPHGLPEEGHYTTAYSLARLMACAMENALFRRVSATRHYTMKSGGTTRHLANHNRLLFASDGVIGGKTGFTKRAGRCLVSVAEKDGATLYAVTLSAPDDWNDHKALYAYGFSHWEAVTVPSHRITLPVIDGEQNTVTLSAPETVLTLPKEREALGFTVEAPRFVYAPTAQGDAVGAVRITLSGTLLRTVPLTADVTVPSAHKPSLWEKIFS